MTPDYLRSMITEPLLDLARAREALMRDIDIPAPRPASDFCPQCGGSMRNWPARLTTGARCANTWHNAIDTKGN